MEPGLSSANSAGRLRGVLSSLRFLAECDEDTLPTNRSVTTNFHEEIYDTITSLVAYQQKLLAIATLDDIQKYIVSPVMLSPEVQAQTMSRKRKLDADMSPPQVLEVFHDMLDEFYCLVNQLHTKSCDANLDKEVVYFEFVKEKLELRASLNTMIMDLGPEPDILDNPEQYDIWTKERSVIANEMKQKMDQLQAAHTKALDMSIKLNTCWNALQDKRGLFYIKSHEAQESYHNKTLKTYHELCPIPPPPPEEPFDDDRTLSDGE